jgi:hypothetical protein
MVSRSKYGIRMIVVKKHSKERSMKKNITIALLLSSAHFCNGMLAIRTLKNMPSKKAIVNVTKKSYSSKGYEGSLSDLATNPDIDEVFSLVCAYVLSNPYMPVTDKMALLQTQIDRTDLPKNDAQTMLYKKGFACMHAMLMDYKQTRVHRPFFEGEKTLFHVAAQENNMPILQAAFQFMPLHNRSLNNLDTQNDTALHIGARNLAIPIVETLCKYGANPNIKNRQGRIPTCVAILTSDDPKDFDTITAITALLHKHGANPKLPDIHDKSALEYVEDGLRSARYYERRTIYVDSSVGEHMTYYEKLKKILTTKE